MMELCQRNSSSPQIWSIISSVVFSALIVQVFGIHFVNSFTTEISQLVWFSFVYNCYMVQSDDDIEDTHFQMKLSISEWGYLLSITGGYLEPYTSKWYLVDY